MKNLMRLCGLLIVLTFFACSTEDTTVLPFQADRTNTTTVIIVDSTNVKGQGNATLVRFKDGVSASFNVKGLKPDYAYTLWWVVLNKPENCLIPNDCKGSEFGVTEATQVEIMFAGLHQVDAFGQSNFCVRLNEHDNTGTINSIFGLPEYGGLQDAETAEVRLVLHSHGRALPGQAEKPIESYLSGDCVMDPAIFTGSVRSEPWECAGTLAAVFKP